MTGRNEEANDEGTFLGEMKKVKEAGAKFVRVAMANPGEAGKPITREWFEKHQNDKTSGRFSQVHGRTRKEVERSLREDSS